MSYCRNCGNQISDDAKFCAKCGTMQSVSAPSEKPKTEQPPASNKEFNDRETDGVKEFDGGSFYPKRKTLLQILYEREMFAAILWIIVGIWQIVAGITYFMAMTAEPSLMQILTDEMRGMYLLDGILFLVFGIVNVSVGCRSIKWVENLKDAESGKMRYSYGFSLLNRYGYNGWGTLIYNIVIWVMCLLAQYELPIFAGCLGVIASAYYILGIRNFVMYNEDGFRKMEEQLRAR